MYCSSGKCQTIHWRQVHKQECQLLEYNGSCASPTTASNEESIHEQLLFGENFDSQCFESIIKKHGHEKDASDDALNSSSTSATSCITIDTSAILNERRSSDKRSSQKFNREILRREESAKLEPSGETCCTSYDNTPSKEIFTRHKPKLSYPVFLKEDIQEKNNVDLRYDSLKANGQHETACNITSNFVFVDLEKSTQLGTSSFNVKTEMMDGWNLPKGDITSNYETQESKFFFFLKEARQRKAMR